MAETLLSYNNDPDLKEKYVSRMRAHRAAERLIQRTGWDGGKGCAIGCTLESYDHSRYPVELGLPLWLAYLVDQVFEGLPKGKAEQFAEDVLVAIPVGVDLEPVQHRLTVARMDRLLEGLRGNDADYAIQCRSAIVGVREWAQQMLAGGFADAESAARSAESAASAARSAESAARGAAWSAARSAASAAWSAESAAWSAESAESAAWSAESAAWSAARSAESAESAESAARSAARSAAWSAAWEWEAETLLSLLRGANG